MPWSKRDYPDSLKNFEPRVRNKAIEIANALLDDGSEEGRAIAIATAQAKEWAADHPQHTNEDSSGSGHANLHVVPHEKEWAIKVEGKTEPEQILSTKAEAVEQARALASDRNCAAIIHRQDGTVEDAHNYR
ncbi:DUF2188 domain-containing protein [Paenibacillus abyssi]|uniref:DUF2188 domain-containing protein n=1 Tax=Paenibacillus abyssi TaxID=1340531 RepID=A0A917CNV6_9BACL|nr:DUF2188 domain-containing protein [Paenibacillus abyssi]GGF92503.1 hypothetical protein GCM10010916_07370 [Paenibacillus abyssi]